MKRRILVVDVGGSFVKLLMSERVEREFASGPRMTPKQFLAKFKETVRAGNSTLRRLVFRRLYATDEFFETRSTLVRNWVHFNFAQALRIPVRIVNDAAMQALGSYLGDGRMLFLGLGTGLGSALVWDRNLMSLELGDLPYPNGKIIENHLGVAGLAELGKRKWKREVLYASAN
jgi:polyphosphate glucokinase